MADKKKIPVKLSTVFLIIAILIILGMICVIFLSERGRIKAERGLEELRAENERLTATTATMQAQIDNLNQVKTNIEKIINNVSSSTSNSTTSTTSTQTATTQKTEEDKIKEAVNAFVKAVNEKDYTTAEKYSNSDVVNSLKHYKVYNMTVDTSKIEKNPNDSSEYYGYFNYEIDFNGISKKDISLGNLFTLEKSGDSYKITSFGATGL